MSIKCGNVYFTYIADWPHVYTCGHAIYCMQYFGPVTEPEQLHPQRDKSGKPIAPPAMFLRSSFFNFLAFFKMLFDM